MDMVRINCVVNDRQTSIESPPGRSLLEVIREDLGLTGTKYGCGEGACGACTVMIDGKRTLSCTLDIEEVEGRKLTTLEGLGEDGKLHPVQQAFLDEGAFQCGYCTAGMVMNAAALLESNPSPSDDEIRQSMNHNICRCGGYPGMLRAVRRAAGASQQEVTP